jgi:hypothetical protein
MPTEWIVDPDTWLSIDTFYELDPRRRASAEINLGTDWNDAHATYGLTWIVDTGELLLSCQFATGTFIRAILEGLLTNGASGTFSRRELRVVVLDTIPTRRELDRRFTGWQERMLQTNSLGWVRQQLSDVAT